MEDGNLVQPWVGKAELDLLNIDTRLIAKLKRMGWMTGFELNQTYRHINKIKHLDRQISAKASKKSANLQPVATRTPRIETHLRIVEMSHEVVTCSLFSSQPHDSEGPYCEPANDVHLCP